MRKGLIFIIAAFLLLLMGCAGTNTAEYPAYADDLPCETTASRLYYDILDDNLKNEEDGNGIANSQPLEPYADDDDSANSQPLEPYANEASASNANNRICPYCGEDHADELLSYPTPPFNIFEWGEIPQSRTQEQNDADFDAVLNGFLNIHSFTHLEFETDWPGRIILWADTPIRDFSFVRVSVSEDWKDGHHLIEVVEELVTIPYLQTTEAFVLNVAFAHYLFPHGAIFFTDEQGSRHPLLILQSMRGGCFPQYFLAPHNPEWILGFDI